jgi:hypothetical protein
MQASMSPPEEDVELGVEKLKLRKQRQPPVQAHRLRHRLRAGAQAPGQSFLRLAAQLKVIKKAWVRVNCREVHYKLATEIFNYEHLLR